MNTTPCTRRSRSNAPTVQIPLPARPSTAAELAELAIAISLPNGRPSYSLTR